jgi:hypothetical protein
MGRCVFDVWENVPHQGRAFKKTTTYHGTEYAIHLPAISIYTDSGVYLTLGQTVMCLDAIADFFNNQSVSAFLGAFAAFLLIAVNDWRRERRKVKTLRAEIEVNRADALAKLETARRMRILLRKHNSVAPAPVLRFNTTFTRQLAAEVLHHLSIDQRRAIEGLCYTMEAIDGLFDESLTLSQKFTTPLGQADRIFTAEHLLKNWGDIVANLKRLLEMCDHYLVGNYTQLVNKQYDAAAYEEP